MALAIAALAACTSYEQRLRPEHDVSELRELGAACDALPYHVEHEVSDADPALPLRIDLHEYGSGDHDRVLVAIHGVLSDHRAWRYVIGGLGGEVDVWAVDLPGCGTSHCPPPQRAGSDGYSPTWLGAHVLSALRARLRRAGRDVRLTLVAHSLGGGTVLRMLGDARLRAEYADVLARVDGAVLLAPLAFKLVHVDPNLVALAQIEDLVFTIGTSVGEVRRAAAEATWKGHVDPRRATLEEFERLYRILVDTGKRHAMQRMLLRAVPRQPDGRVIWDEVLALTADYGNVHVPCLLIWGERDETLPSVHGYELQAQLPLSRLRILADCMHGVMQDRPRATVELIRRFLVEDIATWEEHDRVGAPQERVLVAGDDAQRGLRRNQREDVSVLVERPATESPSTVTVLGGRDIERSGARYFSDALRMLPGIEVQRLSSTESGVSIRGYVDSSTAAQGVLGLLDGRQVYNQFLGNVLWDQLPVRLEDLDRVEIVRGPGSFLHGPNAMHGVVSIKSRAPLDFAESSVSASTHFGSYGSAVAGTTVVARGTHTAVKTSAQWEDIEQFSNARSGTQGKGFFHTAFQAELDGDPDKVLGISGGVSQQRFDLLLPRLEVIPSSVLDNDAQELFVQAEYSLGDPEDQSLDLRVSWTGFDSETAPEAFYAPFTLDLDTLDAEARTTWTGAWHTLTAGLGYRNSTFATTDDDVAGGRHGVDQGWVFAQDEFAVGDALAFTIGLRADLHSETGTVLSPRAAGVLRLADSHFVRASIGRGFRNPTLRELWFDMAIEGLPGGLPTLTIDGNLDLEPECLTSYEVGWFGTFGPEMRADGVGDDGADRHQFEVGISGFYNRVEDLIDFRQDPQDDARITPINVEGEESYGFELEGRYVFADSTSVFANYTLAVRRKRAGNIRNELTPQNTANAGVSWVGYGLNAMLWVHYYDHSELFGLDIPSYVLLNGSVSYGFPIGERASGQIFVRGFNLLDDVHREHPQGDAYGAIVTGGLQLSW